MSRLLIIEFVSYSAPSKFLPAWFAYRYLLKLFTALSIVLFTAILAHATTPTDTLSQIVPTPALPQKWPLEIIPKIQFKAVTVPPLQSRIFFSPEPQYLSYVSIDGLIDLFGNVENYSVALAPQSIEVMRLKKLKRYAVEPIDFSEEKSVSFSPDDTSILRVMLTYDSTFNWEEECDCIPDYEFRVKFWYQKRVISIDLCFLTRTLRVVQNNREIAHSNFEFGAKVIAQLFDRYYPELLEREAIRRALGMAIR
ncbi:MAG: hypothetical protein HZA31_08695 [Opitutae bacterium]|nr:hypothetical protein [Opitutae bacterium]